MPVTVLTKTDESIGREKQEQPLNTLVPVDLDFYETAEEHERQKDALIEHANAINDLEDSVGSIPGAILYDMPIATASVGVAVRFRTNGDTGTPSGTAAKSLVAYESYPNKQALRLSATGLNGGLVWPVLHGITLPEEYILEVAIAGLDAASGGNKGLIFAMCDFYSESGVDSVRGLVHEHYRGFGQVDTRTVARLTGPYAAVNNVITTSGWPNLPNYRQRTPLARYHVRRKLTGGLGTPAQWSLRAVHEGNGSSDLPFHLSGVANPQTDFDGRTFDEIGIGVFGASGNMNIDIARLRIRAA
jgi:hypothetical protein